MKHHNVFTLLSAGWAEMKRNYFLWLLGLIIIDLPATVIYLTAPDNTNHNIIVDKLPAFLVAIIATTWFHFMGKYFLTLIRNSELVRQYLGRALQYSIVDGVSKRFLYHFLNASLRMIMATVYVYFLALLLGVVFVGVPSIFITLLIFLFLSLIYLYFVDSIFFLCSFIIQDTCSDDNELPSLSYWACLRKSAYLMRGEKGRYVCLTVMQLIIIWLFWQLCQFLLVFAGVLLSFFMGGLILLVALVVGLILFSSFQIYFLAPRFIWANDLIESDSEIVDFGD